MFQEMAWFERNMAAQKNLTAQLEQLHYVPSGKHGYDYFFRFDSTQSQKVLIPTQLTTRNGFLEFDSNRLKT